MFDFLNQSGAVEVGFGQIVVRLLAAFVGGTGVAWIYRHTRRSTETAATFPPTLVLLAVLIAMSTQVIGDNVARAFSLVGALSIVRFRTVVRDTQDTAYVIFSVVIGMSVGAGHFEVALLGMVVVGIAAYLMTLKVGIFSSLPPAYVLQLRVGAGSKVEEVLGAVLNERFSAHNLISVETAKQGIAYEMTYEVRLQDGGTPEEVVKALNKVEGVQSAGLRRRGVEVD